MCRRPLASCPTCREAPSGSPSSPRIVHCRIAHWRIARSAFLLLIFAVTLPLSASSANTPKELLAKAQTHLAKGRYEEAEEVFHKAAAAKADPVAVAIGLSRAREAVGAWEEAEKLVVDASKQNSAEPKLLARLAELQLARGRLADAEKTAEAAITAAGGSVERVALPFAQRPPASGNALMNR